VKYQFFNSSKILPKFACKWLDQRIHQSRLHNFGADILHPTYYSLLTGLPIDKIRIPIVVTVWDMIHELYPQYYDPTGAKSAIKKNVISAASLILCISENTKNDLMSFYSIPESKIKVILLAPGIQKQNFEASSERSNPRFFLYVGGRKYHKNFEGLLKAFAKVSTIEDEVALLVVGRPFHGNELQQIGTLRIMNRIHHLGEIGDNQLAELYRQSLALVYPSFYEGFGIPPLEAMTCGTVALVSNRSCLPEIAGQGALFFDPDIPDDLEDKMLAIIRSSTLRDNYIAKGNEWVKRYSWDKTSEQVFSAYRSFERIE
jgi:glycosyltransferase involved in cell wall biosynthesis